MALRRVIHLVSEPQTLILHHPSFLHHRIQCFTSPNLSKEKKIFRHHFSHLYLNCEVDFVSDPWIREENWEEMNAVMAIGAFSGAQLSSCAAFSSQSAGLNVGQSIVKISPRSVAVRAAGMEATILVCKKFPTIFAESHTCTHTNSFELTYLKFQDLVLARNYASLVCGIEKSFLVLCGHVVPHVC